LFIGLFEGSATERSSADRSGGIMINITNQTDGGKDQRLYPGANGTRVGSSFRVLAHELYHVGFHDVDIAKDEDAAVLSANRAVRQNAILQGRPEAAGERICYHDEDCAPLPTEPRSNVSSNVIILD
jgi:hypothetical protein